MWVCLGVSGCVYRRSGRCLGSRSPAVHLPQLAAVAAPDGVGYNAGVAEGHGWTTRAAAARPSNEPHWLCSGAASTVGAYAPVRCKAAMTISSMERDRWPP